MGIHMVYYIWRHVGQWVRESYHSMTDTFKDIEKLEADLWEAADNLRANSKLTSSDYFMPVADV